MTAMALLIPTLIALMAIGLRRRRASVWWLSLVLALYLVVGYGGLTQWLLNGLQTHEKLLAPTWKTRNAIVLLGSGSVAWYPSGQVTPSAASYSRIFEAARLYFSCKRQAPSCQLILSGGDPSQNGLSEAQAMALELRQLGVNQAEMILETRSKNTFQSATFSNDILRTQNFDHVVLVTSGFHMPRALVFFAHFGNKPIPAPADQISIASSWVPVATNFKVLDIALHEYLGMAQYHVYTFLDWDPGRQ